MKNNNEYILALVESGLSVLPITEGGKNPHEIIKKWRELINERATPEEVKRWIDGGVKSWGVIGGAVSGNLVTLDFDEKHYPGLYDLWYAKLSDDQKKVVDTFCKNSTRNKGTHLRGRTQTAQPTIKLARRVEFNKEINKEEIVTTAEIRSEGAYALIPPSIGYETTQGSLLELPVISDEIYEELIDVLRTFNEVEDEPATEYEWKQTDGFSTDRPGDRLNQQATWKEILEPHDWVEESKNHWRRPGKNAGEGISATTNYDGKPMFYVFSTSAHPFKENRGYSKFTTFTFLNCGGDFKKAAKVAAEKYPKEKTINEIKDNSLLNEICSREDVTLFHDEQSDAYIALNISGHQEIWPCKSKSMKRLLASKSWEKNKKPLGSEATKSIVAVLEGKACHDGPKIKLHNRVAWHNDNLWYDLTNEKWQSIKINKDGWEMIDTPPIIFKHHKHQQSQVIPIRNGDINLFLNYINVTNPEHRLLLLVFLVSCFIPDFPHVMLVIFGAQGSSKSTLSKLARLVIDPSLVEVVALPDKQNELVQTLAHHHFLFFDNVSHVSEDASDTICKAVTGSGFSKRELYENDEDIIYKFQRCIGINGINLVTIRPDLLERSLLLELERIDSVNRKHEKEIYDNFAKDLPSILGGTFDILVKTLSLKSEIKVSSLPRMADWALWGCAIAEALGYTKEEFLTSYEKNIDRQAEMLLNENIVATTLFSFMEDKLEWKGTATELLQSLYSKTPIDYFDKQEKYWPKSAGSLSRKLNELSTYLKQMGVSVIISTTGIERYIHIQKITKVKETQKEPMQLSLNDDTDDIIPVSSGK